jgi:spore cortex formation protein SpoVR/YcgB (stage V sporulation)
MRCDRHSVVSDVERIIDDILQLQEMFEAPDIRPLSARDISAAKSKARRNARAQPLVSALAEVWRLLPNRDSGHPTARIDQSEPQQNIFSFLPKGRILPLLNEMFPQRYSNTRMPYLRVGERQNALP